MNKIPMTKQGAEALKEELEDLKKVQRPKVIEAIAEARAHGDLKENAEYHEARRQQSFIEGRIQDIEGKLSNSQVIDVTAMSNNGRVIFGATIDLINLENDEQVRYKIVGEDEADIKAGKISVSSPIARALIGKSKDDVVEVKTPGGLVEYEIAAIHLI